jgi:hypothetical protein
MSMRKMLRISFEQFNAKRRVKFDQQIEPINDGI